jgi:hypothetical protein
MEIVGILAESKLFRSRHAIERITARQAADLLHMHMCALVVLRQSPSSASWAKDYARRTINYGAFNEWRTNSTDLGILGWSLANEECEFRLASTSSRLRAKMTLDETLILRWVKMISGTNFDDNLTGRIFSRLDMWLKIDDESLKSIRRLAQDWTDLSAEDSCLMTTRLLQLLRAHGQQSEILGELEKLAHAHGLEMKGVCNPETGENCGKETRDIEVIPKKKGNFFASLAGVAAGAVLGYQGSKHLHKSVKEDATAGATMAGSVAPMVGALGGTQRRAMPSTIAIPQDGASKPVAKKKKPK